MKQTKLDLAEPLSAAINVRIQPSLLAVFKQRCAAYPTGPLDASDQVRRLMVQWIQDTRDGNLPLR